MDFALNLVTSVCLAAVFAVIVLVPSHRRWGLMWGLAGMCIAAAAWPGLERFAKPRFWQGQTPPGFPFGPAPTTRFLGVSEMCRYEQYAIGTRARIKELKLDQQESTSMMTPPPGVA